MLDAGPGKEWRPLDIFAVVGICAHPYGCPKLDRKRFFSTLVFSQYGTGSLLVVELNILKGLFACVLSTYMAFTLLLTVRASWTSNIIPFYSLLLML
jgi:hypothetical protein